MIEDCEVHTKEWLAEMKMIDRPMLQAVGDVMAQEIGRASCRERV